LTISNIEKKGGPRSESFKRCQSGIQAIPAGQLSNIRQKIYNFCYIAVRVMNKPNIAGQDEEEI
jgi:hypothetical protein